MGRAGAPPGGATPLADGSEVRAPIGPRLAFDLHSFPLRSRHSQIETRREALKETGTPRGADRPATGAGGVLPLRTPVPGRLSCGWAAEAGLRHLLFQPSLPCYCCQLQELVSS